MVIEGIFIKTALYVAKHTTKCNETSFPVSASDIQHKAYWGGPVCSAC